MGSILAKLAQALIVIRPMALGFFECKTYFVLNHGEKRKIMEHASQRMPLFLKPPKTIKQQYFW
jgi:hypothetical protein